MTTIFQGDFFEAMNVRNLLENNAIEVFTTNEMMSNIQPWTVTSGGMHPVALQVHHKDVENAKRLISDFEKGNLKSFKQ